MKNWCWNNKDALERSILLMRIGRGASQNSTSLLIGLFLVIFSCTSLSLIHSTYFGMLDREAARYPNFVSQNEELTEETLEAPLLYAGEFYSDTSDGEPALGLVVAFAESDAASVPKFPELSSYPNLGESYLSPGLLRKYPIGSVSPWGKVTGQIPENVLSTPTEKFFLARILPSDKAGSLLVPVSRFGFQGNETFGDFTNAPSYTYVLILISLFGLVPGIGFILSSVIQNQLFRDHSELLKRLGAKKSDLVFYSIGFLLPAFRKAGLFLIGILLFVCLMTKVPLPLVDAKIVMEDFILSLPLILLFSIFIILFSIVLTWIVAFYGVTKRKMISRKSGKIKYFLKLLQWISLAGGLVAVGVVLVSDDSSSNYTHLLLVGFLLLIFTFMPLFLWLLIRLIYAVSRYLRPTPAIIIALAKISKQSRLIRAILSIVLIAFSLSSLGLVYFSQLSDSAEKNILQSGSLKGIVIEHKCVIDEAGKIKQPEAIQDENLILGTSRLGEDGVYNFSFKTENLAQQFSAGDKKFSLYEIAEKIFPESEVEVSQNFQSTAIGSEQCFSIGNSLDTDLLLAELLLSGNTGYIPGNDYLGAAYITSNLADWYLQIGIVLVTLISLGLCLIVLEKYYRELDFQVLIKPYYFSVAVLLKVLILVIFIPVCLAALMSILISFVVSTIFEMKSASYTGLDISAYIVLGIATAIVTTFITAYVLRRLLKFIANSAEGN